MSVAVETRRAGRSVWVERLGRAGLAAKGISYGIVAVLAILVAIHAGGRTTDRQGALRTVADHPLGRLLLIVLAVGFAAYALWRLAQAFLDRDDEGSGPKGLAKRATYLGRAGIYAALFLSTLSVLLGDDRGSSSGEEDKATAGVLDWPAGRWLVAAAGIAVAGVGLYNAYRGLSRKFEDKLKTGEMTTAARNWVGRLGTVGLLARAVVFCLVGWFLIKAAVEYDPKETVGLDGALAKLAQASYGHWLLAAVAGGLLAYGAFSLAEARYRDV
jgi:Domain of Unknown Function (DUF1206)